MPHHVLRLARVIVRVDVSLSDADTIESGLNQSANNLHAVRVGVAPNIHGLPVRVRPGPRSPVGLFPLNGPVCGI